ncbi:MAG: hypothetical protein QM820_01560 [Minicystis sp.]
MPSVLAIISKAIYERDARVGGRLAGVGDVVPLDQYVSKNKALAPVASGGALFLVTVRPPDEALWLVAILESPAHDGERWKSPPNTIAVTDVSILKDEIKLAHGAGIQAKKGALGMSLQTPRVLSDEDVALLRAATGSPTGVGAQGASKPASTRRGEKGHLNAHEIEAAAPCLCWRCLPAAPDRVEIGGLAMVRDRAAAGGRFVWYWLPESIAPDRDAIRRAVESRLHGRARAARGSRVVDDLDAVFEGDEEDE